MYGNASKLLVLIMHTGLRVSEASALRWEDVDIINRTLRVQSSLLIDITSGAFSNIIRPPDFLSNYCIKKRVSFSFL